MVFRDESQLDLETRNKIVEIETMIMNKQIPYSYPDIMIDNWSIQCHQRRGKFIEQMGFILLANSWLRPLSKWIGNRKCLEIMSGSGSLSYGLSRHGVNIKATDNFTWDGQSNWNTNKNYWTEIENIDCIDAIDKYGKDIDIVICSWAYMDDTLYRAVCKMREINPNCVLIYIGEGYGGCTANDNFFNIIEDINDPIFENAISTYQTWRGIHDCIQLGK